MTDTNEHLEIDPLRDSAESVRAKRAQMRVGTTTGDGTFAPIEPKARKQQMNSSAYGNFLFSSAGAQSRPAWSDSTGGRAVIRTISRGVFGAAFFAAAGRMSRAQLQDYDPHAFDYATAKPLAKIAKAFDTVIGTPIAGATRGIARLSGKSAIEAEQIAWNAVNFRTKGFYHTQNGRMMNGRAMNGRAMNGRAMNGRSLGHEMVSISFDFAMMSVGDAMIRNFVQMIDPNIRKTWMVNDEGETAAEGEKSRFSFTKWVQSTGKAAWRVASKNQGEDWAVALPYIYQMRLQRALFSRAFSEKGSKIVFDNGWNGAAWKVDNAGKIVGDYQLAGAMDLHGRFVGYNVYTLIFREGYDTISHSFKNWKEKGYPLNVKMPEHFDPVDRVRRGARYVVKSFIKANMYMNPAVIPFWLMRTPQTKWRGGMIAAEAGEGINALASKTSFNQQVEAAMAQPGNEGKSFKQMTDAMVHHHQPIESGKGVKLINYNTAGARIVPGGPNGAEQPKTMWIGNKEVPNPLNGMKDAFDTRIYDNYKKGPQTTFSKALNPFGKFSHWLGGKATEMANGLSEKNPIHRFISIEEGAVAHGQQPKRSKAGAETFMRNMVDASLAYTPYFFTKAELGLRVDDRGSDGSLGRMDKAIYKLMDNVWKLDGRKSVASVKEMWHLSTTINKDPISREGSAAAAASTAIVSTEVPKTSIEAKGSVRQKPVELSRDPEHHAPTGQDDAPAAQSGRRWAEVVSGRNLAAHYVETPTHTRH